MSKAQLPEQIKQLRRPERTEPLLAAIESLEEPSPEAHERLWAAEIDQRYSNYKGGKTQGIPYQEVMRDVEARLR
jgi:hypothetical protein